MTEIEIKKIADSVHPASLVSAYSKSLAECFAGGDSVTVGPTDLTFLRTALKHTVEAAQVLLAATADHDEVEIKGMDANLAEGALRYTAASVG